MNVPVRTEQIEIKSQQQLLTRRSQARIFDRFSLDASEFFSVGSIPVKSRGKEKRKR